MGESYKNNLNKPNFIETLYNNTVLRVVGFLIRSITIFLGLVAIFWTTIFSIVIVLSWLLAPVVWFLLLVLVVETVI